MSLGILELTDPELIGKDRVRKKGGGRKTGLETVPDIDEKFIMVIWDHTAGDPMDEKISQTDLTCQQIADRFETEGVEVCGKIVKNFSKSTVMLSERLRKS